MKANIEKSFFVDQPIQKVWANLSNPIEVVECVPGASITEQLDDKNYKGLVTLKFGPVKTKYNGEITIDKLDLENHEMIMKGRGIDAKGKGSADMIMHGRLKEKDGGTTVDYSMEITVTGMLAQFGSRLITDVSDHLAAQFIENFKNKLAGQVESSGDNAVDAGAMMGSIVKKKISGIFGNKKE